MELVRKDTWLKNSYLTIVKSFLIWCFTLAVCLLVIGFPVGVLIVTVGILLTITLQSVLPASALLLVTSGIVMMNICIVAVGAGVLTFKGIHPTEVSWLHWLHGQEKQVNNPIYAACPLTCDLKFLNS